MVLASLSKIWHIIPIIIAIILFKKFITHKDKKNMISKNLEKEKSGFTLKLRTIEKYENLGYKVEKDMEDDQYINLHISKDDKIILLRLNNTSTSKSIKDTDIIAFIDNATNYINSNNLDDTNIDLRYVVPYGDVFHKSALKILGMDSYGCKYVVI